MAYTQFNANRLHCCSQMSLRRSKAYTFINAKKKNFWTWNGHTKPNIIRRSVYNFNGGVNFLPIWQSHLNFMVGALMHTVQSFNIQCLCLVHCSYSTFFHWTKVMDADLFLLLVMISSVDRVYMLHVEWHTSRMSNDINCIHCSYSHRCTIAPYSCHFGISNAIRWKWKWTMKVVSSKILIFYSTIISQPSSLSLYLSLPVSYLVPENNSERLNQQMAQQKKSCWICIQWQTDGEKK